MYPIMLLLTGNPQVGWYSSQIRQRVWGYIRHLSQTRSLSDAVTPTKL